MKCRVMDVTRGFLVLLSLSNAPLLRKRTRGRENGEREEERKMGKEKRK